VIARLTAVFVLLLGLVSAAVGASSDLAATADPRLLQAQQKVRIGDVEGAVGVWVAIRAEAREHGDRDLLDSAEHALAELAFLRGHYDEFEAIHSERLARAQAGHDRRLQADARMQLALLDRRRGRLEESRLALEQALALFRAVGSRDGEAEALTHLGLVLLNQGAFDRAIEVLDASLAMQHAGARSTLDRTYHYLGLLYLGLRDHAQARQHLDRALLEARRLDDPMRASPPLGSLARIANEQGMHADALNFAAESKALSLRFQSTPGLAYSALERGRALLGLERLQEAREALQEARILSLSIHQDRTAADATFSLGRLALKEADPLEALRQFEAAVPNYEAAGDLPQLYEAYTLMVPLLREQGDLPRALALAEASRELLEQISGREMSRRIALIEYRYDAQASQRQIEQLAGENEIKALRLERQELARRIAMGVIAGLLLVASGLLWMYRRSQRIGARLAASNAELDASRRQLAATNATLAEKAAALQVAATSDALTGIANRRHVLATLTDALDAANRDGLDLAVLLLDVDRFKAINDLHGHAVGDAVLIRVVDSVLALLPPNALLGRYGGEEFLLVLPGHDLAAALQVAESLLMAVRGTADTAQPRATLSIGIAARRPGVAVAVAALIEQADRALYQAKRSGRDRAVG